MNDFVSFPKARLSGHTIVRANNEKANLLIEIASELIQRLMLFHSSHSRYTWVMASFIFDQNKDFTENLNAFIDCCSSESAEFAAILRDNIGLLTAASDDDSRRKARATFNKTTLSKLDSLQKQSKNP